MIFRTLLCAARFRGHFSYPLKGDYHPKGKSFGPQQSLCDSIADLEKAGLVKRYIDEKRVDELPILMEQNPDTAVLVEKVKDCAFPFYAQGYGVRAQYALALDCDPKKVGLEIANMSQIAG